VEALLIFIPLTNILIPLSVYLQILVTSLGSYGAVESLFFFLSIVLPLPPCTTFQVNPARKADGITTRSASFDSNSNSKTSSRELWRTLLAAQGIGYIVY